MEQRAVRLAHHLGQHVEASAVRHAQHDVLHAEIAAALDDLLERRNQRFSAIETEPLGTGEFDIAELLEALGFDELRQDGAAAFPGEADFLVRTFDALLNPALLRRIRDVHEFYAQRLAIGALTDRDDLTQRCGLKTQYMVEENLAIEIGIGEAVGARIEFLVILLALDTKRIEIGVEVTAHPVGANQHQRAHRIARGLLHVSRSEGAAGGLRLGCDLAANGLFDLSPVAVERVGQIVSWRGRPVGLFPGRALRVLGDVRGLIFQRLEEINPVGIDR